MPEALYHLAWRKDDNTLSTEEAELWMAHIVPHFAALQAEWDDRKAQKRNRKGFESDRLARLREVGYVAFKVEFDALHEERRTLKDVDGWLLKKHRDSADDFPPTTNARDAKLIAAEKSYVGRRLKSSGCPWIIPFRRHSGVENFDSVDRSRLWPGGCKALARGVATDAAK